MRGASSLSYFASLHSPALIFLSEPQLFQCDSSLALASLPDFCHHLNSADSFLPSLALDQRKAWGGTLAMWHKSLDPFLTVLPTTSPAVLPIHLNIPGLSPSLHIGLYLPTSGRETDFFLALTVLDTILTSLSEEYRDTPIYLRGDANVNPNHPSRPNLFHHILSKHSISSLDLHHPTHHHFTGDGGSDAQLDVLLYSGAPGLSETLMSITCGLTNPLVSSHHDLIISSFPSLLEPITTPPQAVVAPRVPNTRVKVCWDEEGMDNYKSLLSSTLPLLQESLSSPSSPALTSILLESTNEALRQAASAAFRTIQLSATPRPRPLLDPLVRAARKDALQKAEVLASVTSSPSSSPQRVAQAKTASSLASSALRRP